MNSEKTVVDTKSQIETDKTIVQGNEATRQNITLKN